VPQRDTSPAPGPGVALETPGRTVAEKPEIATRASRPAETCPTCDCSGLAEKKFFTVEPMRREEQAWYGAHCEH
jgi:hypothetical protein